MDLEKRRAAVQAILLSTRDDGSSPAGELLVDVASHFGDHFGVTPEDVAAVLRMTVAEAMIGRPADTAMDGGPAAGRPG